MSVKVILYHEGYEHQIIVSRFFGLYSTTYRAVFCEEIGRFKFVNTHNDAIIDITNSEYLYNYLLKELLKAGPLVLSTAQDRLLNKRQTEASRLMSAMKTNDGCTD